MNTCFRASLSEMNFILNFAELLPLPWMREAPHMSMEEVRQCAASLLQKQYLLRDGAGEYYLDRDLSLLLKASDLAAGRFLIEDGRDGKEAVFFQNDMIVLCRQDGEEIELMWLPALPLLVGQIANMLTPFLNGTSNTPETRAGAELDAVREELQAEGYALQWSFSAQGADAGAERPAGWLYADGREQVLLLTAGSGLTVWKPDKKDTVNAITRLIAPLHGDAIRRGGLLDGRD